MKGLSKGRYDETFSGEDGGLRYHLKILIAYLNTYDAVLVDGIMRNISLKLF